MQGFRRLAAERVFDDAAVSTKVSFAVSQDWHALLVIVNTNLQLVTVSVVDLVASLIALLVLELLLLLLVFYVQNLASSDIQWFFIDVFAVLVFAVRRVVAIVVQTNFR